jgi:hypothetical protein
MKETSRQIRIAMMLLIAFAVLCSGCISPAQGGGVTVGVKKEIIPIYVTLGQHDEALDGLIRIATSEPVPVTVGDELTNLNLGGYYAVHEQDLKAFRDEIEKAECDERR